MCNITHLKASTKSRKFLLKNNDYLLKSYIFNTKCISFNTKLLFLIFLTCANLYMIKKPQFSQKKKTTQNFRGSSEIWG